MHAENWTNILTSGIQIARFLKYVWTFFNIMHERIELYNVDILQFSSVIRQKGESQNGCYKKTKHAKFSEKGTFLTP